MKLDRITFGRVQNAGNYCSQRVEVTAILEDGDTVEETMETLRAVVAHQLGEGPSDGDIARAESILKQRDGIAKAVSKATGRPKLAELETKA